MIEALHDIPVEKIIRTRNPITNPLDTHCLEIRLSILIDTEQKLVGEMA